MSEKGIGSKLLGIFVETDGSSDDAHAAPPPSARGKSPADLVAELARTSGPVSHPAAPPAAGTPHPAAAPMALTPGVETNLKAAASAGSLDFEAICKSAGMDPSELDRVKKAEDLLKSLPEATPNAVKKQIVEASLKAFGFEIDKIVSAAQNQKRALDAYVKVNETGTAKAIEDAQKQIQSLTEKIAQLRGEIEKKTQTLTSVTQGAQGRKAEVQRVIDFFAQPAAPQTQG